MKLYHVIVLAFLLNLNFASNNNQKKIQESLIFAKKGSTIILPEGIIEINRTLWGDNLQNVSIVGAGIDKTILSFKNQIEGPEGIKITNSNNIILEGFTIQNSKGDLIKVEDTKGIAFIS